MSNWLGIHYKILTKMEPALLDPSLQWSDTDHSPGNNQNPSTLHASETSKRHNDNEDCSWVSEIPTKCCIIWIQIHTTNDS